MPSAAVLSHSSVAHELGHLEPWLDQHGFTVERLLREDGPAIPEADLLIVLGSPSSVANGYCEAPGTAEVAQVSAWIDEGRPYLGICFGAQVLALALGGSVRRLPAAFVGYVPLEVSDLAPEPVSGPWLVWHNDAITAPASAEVLGSLDHADLVFRQGRAWGLQPHIELTSESLDRMGIALGADETTRGPLVDALRADDDGARLRARALLDAFASSALSQ